MTAGAGARRRLPVIGLTGAPGSGKSAVAGLLAARGGVVVDADALARAVTEEPEVLAEIARWWGTAVIDGRGGLDRAAVGRIVFGDPVQRRRLEGLVHPRVAERRRTLHAEAADNAAARFLVEDCPLLLESGLAAACDAVWLVEAPLEARTARVASRGWDRDELARRDAAQVRDSERAEAADACLANSGTERELAKAVDEALAVFLRSGASAASQHGADG